MKRIINANRPVAYARAKQRIAYLIYDFLFFGLLALKVKII